MLKSLSIKNVVLIENLSINFEAGFCALTGETGAGKSILLDALGLALGARSDTAFIRAGKDSSTVTASFDVSDKNPIHIFLKGHGLESDHELILRRAMSRDGRSRAFINDQPVSARILKEAGEMLVEIQGQFDAHGLLDVKTHRRFLDEYAGCKRQTLLQLWNGWQQSFEILTEELFHLEKASKQEGYLRSSIDDLDALDPKEGEEKTLSVLRERLKKRDLILESLGNAYEGLTEADSLVGSSWRLLERGGEVTDHLSEGAQQASLALQDVLSNIQQLLSELEFSDYSLEEIDDRLHALRDQARKHGCDIDGLQSIKDELTCQLNKIELKDSYLDELRLKADRARSTYIQEATKIRDMRIKAAKALDRLVLKELAPLKLDKARFKTQVAELSESEWGPEGMDRIQFLVATNPGSELGPLHKIASGGELARLTLALKVVMADPRSEKSLVFDEVDSGVGGPTAAAVGERLAKLAQVNQVLVVTHSPQVAARAKHHWLIVKDGSDNMTTKVVPLSEIDTRREEVARMLSGASISKEARAAAGKLLETGT